MNSMRKILCFLMAMTFAAFALPGFAATKQFNVTLSAIAADGSMTATFNNLSTGNSVIKSEAITVPSGFTITSASAQAPFTGVITPTCTANAPCTTIQINFQSGIPINSSATLQLTVTVPATAACSQTTWTASEFSAFTGNNLGGSIFSFKGAPPTTGSQCSLGFVKQPTNAKVSTTITSVAGDPAGAPVQVALFDASNSVQTSFTGVVTLTSAGPGTGALTGGSVNAVSGVASFPSLMLDKTGLYSLKAASPGSTSAFSDSFTIFAGTLNCGQPFDSTFTNPDNLAKAQPGFSEGMRGAYNKDGVSTTCVVVPYTFTNTILTNDQVQLSWDTGIQLNAAFMYSMNWRLRNVETTNPLTGWTITPRPQVAWIADGSGNPIFVPGLACLSGKLPTPYGTLDAEIDANATSITIDGVAGFTAANAPTPSLIGAPAVPATPFPVVIPNKVNPILTERMTATGTPTVSGTSPGPYSLTYTVTRGLVTEGFSAKAVHAAGAEVVSTPLPIIPNDTTSFPPAKPYVVNTQAHMCIAEHGFGAFAIGPDGTTQIMYFTTVIDIGDGWVTLL